MPRRKAKTKAGPTLKEDVSLVREQQAWGLRCKGWNNTRIAKEIGVDHATVTSLLGKARKRAKKDISDYVVEHLGQLDHIMEQMSNSWDKSLEPRMVVRTTTDAEGNEVTVQMAEERNGTVGYIDRWLAALDSKAKVLGLNVADAQQEQAFTISSLSSEMKDRRKAYEARKLTQVPPGDPGERAAVAGDGAGGVPE